GKTIDKDGGVWRNEIRLVEEADWAFGPALECYWVGATDKKEAKEVLKDSDLSIEVGKRAFSVQRGLKGSQGEDIVAISVEDTTYIVERVTRSDGKGDDLRVILNIPTVLPGEQLSQVPNGLEGIEVVRFGKGKQNLLEYNGKKANKLTIGALGIEAKQGEDVITLYANGLPYIFPKKNWDKAVLLIEKQEFLLHPGQQIDVMQIVLPYSGIGIVEGIAANSVEELEKKVISIEVDVSFPIRLRRGLKRAEEEAREGINRGDFVKKRVILQRTEERVIREKWMKNIMFRFTNLGIGEAILVAYENGLFGTKGFKKESGSKLWEKLRIDANALTTSLNQIARRKIAEIATKPFPDNNLTRLNTPHPPLSYEYYSGGEREYFGIVVAMSRDMEYFDEAFVPFYEQTIKPRLGGVVFRSMVMDISEYFDVHVPLEHSKGGRMTPLRGVLIKNTPKSSVQQGLINFKNGVDTADSLAQAKRAVEQFLQRHLEAGYKGIVDSRPHFRKAAFALELERSGERVMLYSLSGLSREASQYDPEKFAWERVTDKGFEWPELKEHYDKLVAQLPDKRTFQKKYFDTAKASEYVRVEDPFAIDIIDELIKEIERLEKRGRKYMLHDYFRQINKNEKLREDESCILWLRLYEFWLQEVENKGWAEVAGQLSEAIAKQPGIVGMIKDGKWSEAFQKILPTAAQQNKGITKVKDALKDFGATSEYEKTFQIEAGYFELKEGILEPERKAVSSPLVCPFGITQEESVKYLSETSLPSVLIEILQNNLKAYQSEAPPQGLDIEVTFDTGTFDLNGKTYHRFSAVILSSELQNYPALRLHPYFIRLAKNIPQNHNHEIINLVLKDEVYHIFGLNQENGDESFISHLCKDLLANCALEKVIRGEVAGVAVENRWLGRFVEQKFAYLIEQHTNDARGSQLYDWFRANKVNPEFVRYFRREMVNRLKSIFIEDVFRTLAWVLSRPEFFGPVCCCEGWDDPSIPNFSQHYKNKNYTSRQARDFILDSVNDLVDEELRGLAKLLFERMGQCADYNPSIVKELNEKFEVKIANYLERLAVEQGYARREGELWQWAMEHKDNAAATGELKRLLGRYVKTIGEGREEEQRKEALVVLRHPQLAFLVKNIIRAQAREDDIGGLEIDFWWQRVFMCCVRENFIYLKDYVVCSFQMEHHFDRIFLETLEKELGIILESRAKEKIHGSIEGKFSEFLRDSLITVFEEAGQT
ncbi:MAG: hypothetical protein WAX79_09110, partial [Candidatus Omnitrophota bacterium]